MRQKPTIKISQELKKQLESYGNKGDTFDDIIKEILNQRKIFRKTINSQEFEIDCLKKEIASLQIKIKRG